MSRLFLSSNIESGNGTSGESVLEELDCYYASELPIRRPNSMNNYGIIVNEIGLEATISSLQRRFLEPIAAALFPRIGSRCDSHHSFMVQVSQAAAPPN
jgi:hypothetical protein